MCWDMRRLGGREQVREKLGKTLGLKDFAAYRATQHHEGFVHVMKSGILARVFSRIRGNI